jgi:hypothetical protein
MDVENFEQMVKVVIMLFSSMVIMVVCQHLGHQMIYRKLGIKGIRIFIMPFVLLHEIAHFAVAALCGFKNIRMNINGGLHKELGSVTYSYHVNYLAVMGVALTSFAPLILAIFLIHLICQYSGINILSIPIEKEIVGSILVHFYDTLYWYETMIGVILLCGISLGLTPSIQDLRVAVRGLFLMVLFSTLIIVGMTFLNISLIEEVLYGLSILARLFVIAASASVVAFIALSAAYQIPRLFSKVGG